MFQRGWEWVQYRVNRLVVIGAIWGFSLWEIMLLSRFVFETPWHAGVIPTVLFLAALPRLHRWMMAGLPPAPDSTTRVFAEDGASLRWFVGDVR